MKQHNEEEAILSLLELLPSYFQYFNNFTELKELQKGSIEFEAVSL